MGKSAESVRKAPFAKDLGVLPAVVGAFVGAFYALFFFWEGAEKAGVICLAFCFGYILNAIILFKGNEQTGTLLLLGLSMFGLFLFDDASGKLGTDIFYLVYILASYQLIKKRDARLFYAACLVVVLQFILVHFTSLSPQLNKQFSGDLVYAKFLNLAIGVLLTFVLLSRILHEKNWVMEQVLRKNNEFSAVLENTTVGIWLVDRDFQLVSFNTAFRNSIYILTGKEPIVGENFAKDLPSDLGVVLIGHYKKAMEGLNVMFEQYLPLPNGLFNYTEFRFSPVLGEEGEVEGVTCFSQDITSRKISEFRLASNQERLKIAQKIGQMGSFVLYLRSGRNRFSQEFFELQEVESDERSLFESYFLENIQSDSWRFIHPEDKEKVLSICLEAIEKQKDFQVEYRYLSKSGTLRYFRSTGHYISDSGKGESVIYGTLQDITDFKKVQHDLEFSQIRLRELIDNSNDSICSIDLNGGLLTWNKKLQDLVSDRLNEKVREGLSIFSILRTDRDRQIMRDAVQKAAEGNIYRFDFTPAGTERFYEVSMTPVFDSFSQVRVITIYIDDRSEQHIILKQRQSRDKLIQSIYENIQDGIIRTSLEGDVLFVNKGWCEMTGFLPEELIGHSISKIEVDPILNEEVHDLIQYKGILRNRRVRLRKNDGAEIWVSITISQNRDEEGMWLDMILHDISKEIEIENTLRQAKQDAELAMRARTDFISTMSHEIRTPMNAIIGLTSLVLQEDGLSDQVRQNLGAIQFSGQNLVSIVNDILDFSKIEAGKMKILSQPFRLDKLLQELRISLLSLAEEKNLELNIQLSPHAPVSLIGDPIRLNQILVNLCGNAIKFTHTGGVGLRVLLSERTQTTVDLVFEVEDTGIGIASEKMNSIFESFSQLNTGYSKQYGGTGLGLAITKKLVDLQGGRISVESELGQGSTFRVCITYGISTLVQKERVGVEKNNSLEGARILVVDDNIMNLMVAAQMIKRWNGDVRTAKSGFEALEIVGNEEFDLVLLDIQMPEMDGFEVLGKLRSNELTKNLPVIALTADAFEETRKKALEEGMNDFVTKPFKALELFEKIESLLPRATV